MTPLAMIVYKVVSSRLGPGTTALDPLVAEGPKPIVPLRTIFDADAPLKAVGATSVVDPIGITPIPLLADVASFVPELGAPVIEIFGPVALSPGADAPDSV